MVREGMPRMVHAGSVPWELTKEGSSTAGSSGMQEGHLVLPAGLIPALPLPSQAVEQPWSSHCSQRPRWSLRQFGQLWPSPRGSRFPMTHSSGWGEIIGKVASVALSVREHRRAGARQGRGEAGAAKVSPGWREPGAAAASCRLQLPCSREKAPSERAGNAACRETGRERAGSTAPAERGAHRGER